MSFTQERFDQLVQKLEGFARKSPGSYRLRVGLLAALGYGYLFLLLAGALGLLALLVLAIVYLHRVNAGMIKLGFLLLILVWVIGRSLWVRFPPPEGVPLTRQQVPRLFALVDELTTQLQAPRFHHILMTRDFNAAVEQRPRLGIFGWQQNYLIVGLPLMQGLSLEQFKAVLAHELGHLSGNHARFGGWIYRVQKTWMQLLGQLDQGASSLLFHGFFNWYAPFFSAYSFVLRRMNEYEADRCAAQLAGANHTAEALINVSVKARLLEEGFWSEVYNRVADQPDPPAQTYTQMMTALRQPVPITQGDRWLEQALAEQTDTDDTHPCLRDRLQALGYAGDPQTLPLPGSLSVSAADQLLGQAVQTFVMQFDQDWHLEVSTSWRQKYASIQEGLTRLEQLAAKASLTPEEHWQQATLTWEIRGDVAALPLIQAIVAQQPNFALGQYALGQILLNQEDPAGVAHLERAIELNPDWTFEGYKLIYGFFLYKGQTEEAERYRKRAEERYQIWQLYKQERSIVTERDTLQPHELPPEEIAALCQQLAELEEVQEAYLVRKQVTHLPEHPFYVLGVVRKRPFFETSREGGDQKAIEHLAEQIETPLHLWITLLNQENSGKLKKKISRVEKALIYRRP